MNPNRPFPPAVLRTAAASFLCAALTTACASGGGGPSSEDGVPRPGAAGAAARAAAPAEEAAPAGEGGPADRRQAAPERMELPSIPHRRDSVDLEVVYPGSGRLVQPDSNFIFGSVGTGDARLRINGHEVEVKPNGAFLAWLPVPEARGGDRVARYRLVAWRTDDAGAGPEEDPVPAGRDSVVQTHAIRRPAGEYRPPESGAWIDPNSAGFPGLRWVRPDELLTFSLRAAPEGRVWLAVGGERFPMEAAPGSDRYRTALKARSLEAAYCGRSERCLRVAEAPEVSVEFAALVNGETARLERKIRLRLLGPAMLPVVELREAPNPEHGQTGRVVGRPTAYGPYAWRFPEGTRAEVTGRRGDRLRLAVPGGSGAWVSAEDARFLPEGAGRPRATVGDLHVAPEADRLRLEIPLESAVPVTVAQPGPNRLELRLHGVRAATERIEYGPTDPLLERVGWDQAPGPATQIEFALAEPLWGYEMRWVGDPGPRAGSMPESRLVLEIRRPPAIDPEEPLRGRTVAVDPGHPGGGAYGPTGYYEGDANLAIARRLVGMLRERGAHPVLIRDDTLPMGLYERTNRAVETGAELFVSIHNNALPDGIRPFGEEGTSTYYYHPHARELAESVQAGMLLEMGLRDLGIFWGNLAVARLSWMPSVLAEGAFMMVPRHEAALKTPEFQRAYARGVLKGLQGFLARRAEESGGR